MENSVGVLLTASVFVELRRDRKFAEDAEFVYYVLIENCGLQNGRFEVWAEEFVLAFFSVFLVSAQ